MRAPIVAHISIVDDDPAVRRTTLDLMQSSGFAANAFASAEDFLASRAWGDTTCLILDVKMEGMGGVELQRRLRAKGLHIPIIFITADNVEGVRAQALKGGAIGFLLKPVNPEELFRAVRLVLNTRMEKGNEREKGGVRAPIVAHISIVDDDPAVRRTTLDLMQSSGFAANAFASAEDFLASRALGDTACLILDVKMEGMGGVELQRQLRAKGFQIPIIFITAHNVEGVRAQALKEGAIAFLLKPINSQELFRAVRSVLNVERRK